jgi:hypothetical protein
MKRGGSDSDPAFFAELPMDDPHHVDSQEQKLEKARLKRAEISKKRWDARAEIQASLFREEL